MYTVSWEDTGEGMSGDYDATDPHDVPLLRFYVEQDGQDVEDGSYCTLIPVGTSQSILDKFSERILDAMQDSSGYKRKLEELTWLTVEQLNEAV